MMKLGKKPPRFDARTLQFEKYVTGKALPPLKQNLDWGVAVRDWGPMKNDAIGDCTCAGAGHLIQSMTANAGNEKVISDADVVKAYSAVSGYDPTTGANDNGAVLVDVLNYWRQTGIGGHKIAAYAQVNHNSPYHLMSAANIFGGLYCGAKMPVSAKQQVGNGKHWEVVPPVPLAGDSVPGSWGGHCFPVLGYQNWSLRAITWGDVQDLTWAWWHFYADEAFCVITEDWIAANGKAPSGFDLPALMADLQIVSA